MGFFDRFKNKSKAVSKFKMVTETGNGFYTWNGKIYHSDIVRACIRPKVKAVGKLVAKHIRNEYSKSGGTISVNPEPYLKFLLEEPNEFMSMQKLLEKVTAQLCLNKNAFILIIRDDNGFPTELYPIPAITAEHRIINGESHLHFWFQNGNQYTFRYKDIIHLREDYNENDIFGTGIMESLAPLMEIVNTTDQGIVKAVRNSSVIKWLLKFAVAMRPEDLEKQAEQFAKNFMSVENGDGVAAVDSKADAQQITPNDYVPNAAQLTNVTRRIYSFFNTNEKIIQSSFSEDEWNAYYEQEIEPVVIDLDNSFTLKLFSRKERSYGNRIEFGAFNLSTASMSTKLQLSQMVDRGAMTANEWRSTFGLPAIPGGDEVVRRLDTAPVEQTKGGGD